MNPRHPTLGLLTLSVLLSACGGQDRNAGVPSGSAQPRTAAHLAPVLGAQGAQALPGQYIVVFSEGAQTLAAQQAGPLVRTLGLDPQGVSVQHVYSQSLKGFAGRLSDQNLDTLRADPRVKYIEADSRVQVSDTQTGATWGLDRIDQRDLPLNGAYSYGTTASNVTAYIIDTGINTAHAAFGGRAVWGTNASGDGNDSDCQGHGTHVAGTVGSAAYGVAKGVRLVAVKVLNCQGSGTTSAVIAGVNWALNDKLSRNVPAVANMSLGGSASQALDDAVQNAASKNLVVVVAAGNENRDACGGSPARAPSMITVGATTSGDARASFSNYGSCVDLFAPGVGITSAWTGSSTAARSLSGTSMASPHAAGAAALILAGNPSFTTAQVTSTLLGNTTSGKVTSPGASSPNRLLFTLGGAGSPAPAPTPTPSTTTYTGSVSSGTSSFKPGAGGFSYAGGTLKASLQGPGGTDFDLYLQRLQGGSWTDVAASEGGSSTEGVTYGATQGTYRWEVFGYSGSGSYTLTETR